MLSELFPFWSVHLEGSTAILKCDLDMQLCEVHVSVQIDYSLVTVLIDVQHL